MKRKLGAVIAVAVATLGIGMPDAAAAPAVATATHVNTVLLSQLAPPVPDSSGITYIPSTDRLLIGDSEVEEMAIYQGVNLWTLTRSGAKTATGTTTAWSNEPTGLGYDPGGNRLFVSDDVAKKVFEVTPGGDGSFGTGDDVRRSWSTSLFGSGDPEDIAFDTSSGDLFVSDGTGNEVYRLQAGPDALFGTNDDIYSHFDVAVYGATDSEGLGYDSARDTLLVADRNTKKIYETTTAGQLVTTIDITAGNLSKPADVEVAPSSQGTGARNLFIVQRGIDNDNNPTENDGKMVEMAVNLNPSGNRAPDVSAGLDQQVTLPAQATLSGSVTDDGLPNPPGTLSSTWTPQSGPGTVSFGNANSPSTTASFSGPGTYVLRLTGSDTQLSAFDEVTVTVNVAGTVTLDRPISTGSDDAEESVTGKVRLTSSDLELVFDGTDQVVGLRFTQMAIPAGATINAAYVQFEVDEVTNAPAQLMVKGELAPNPGTFTTLSRSISTRAPTNTAVPWTPNQWPTKQIHGLDQRTPDLSGVLQEIIGQSGWWPGNSVVLIITGTGKRTAESFEGTADPVLHVEFTTS